MHTGSQKMFFNIRYSKTNVSDDFLPFKHLYLYKYFALVKKIRAELRRAKTIFGVKTGHRSSTSIRMRDAGSGFLQGGAQVKVDAYPTPISWGWAGGG